MSPADQTPSIPSEGGSSSPPKPRTANLSWAQTCQHVESLLKTSAHAWNGLWGCGLAFSQHISLDSVLTGIEKLKDPKALEAELETFAAKHEQAFAAKHEQAFANFYPAPEDGEEQDDLTSAHSASNGSLSTSQTARTACLLALLQLTEGKDVIGQLLEDFEPVRHAFVAASIDAASGQEVPVGHLVAESTLDYGETQSPVEDLRRNATEACKTLIKTYKQIRHLVKTAKAKNDPEIE